MPPENGPTLEDLGAVVNSGPSGPESVAESLLASYGDFNGADGGTDPNAGPESEPVVADQPPDSVPVEGGQVRIQNRAPDGKYDAGFEEGAEPEPKPEGEPEPKPEGEPEPITPTPTPTPEVKEPETEPLEPVPSWSVEDHAAFRELTPQQQRFMMSKIEASSASATPSRLQQILQPYEQGWKQLYGSSETALEQLLQLNQFASQRPVDFVNWFMGQRGLTAAQLAAPAGQPAGAGTETGLPAGIDPDDPALNDPIVKMIIDQNKSLASRLDQFQNQFTTAQTSQEQIQRTQAQTELQQFSGAKDAAGNLLHPYFEEVSAQLANILQPNSGWNPSSLEEAYDMACRAHPTVHLKIAQAEKAKAERARKAEDAKKASAAKTAAVSVSGATGNVNTPAAPTGDLRADLRTEFAKHGMLPNAQQIQ